MPSGVFSGPDSVRTFLDPHHNPPTPLIELPSSLNPFRDAGVRIYAKRMDMLPLGNVKSVPALAMLKEAKLDGVTTLVENSSGNTVSSLAVLGRAFGIPNTKALVSNEVSAGKLEMLRLFGAEVIVNMEPICPDPLDPTSGIHQARQMGQQEGWLNPGQYDNASNPQAHHEYTGPQIWEQLEGSLTVFAAGLGTTGTMIGTGSYLKEQNPTIRTVGAVRSPNNPVPGVRTESLLSQIAFDWRSVVDSLQLVGTKDAYLASLSLCREGIVVGPSSGFALSALLQYLAEQKGAGTLEQLRNSNGEVVAAFICCDSPYPYLHEYFEYLDEQHFPAIHNRELLNNKHSPAPKSLEAQSDFEIPAAESYPLLYTDSEAVLWEKALAMEEVSLPAGVVLLDVRRLEEFNDAHLPGATRMEMNEILENPERAAAMLRGATVYTVCRSGGRSGTVTSTLRKYGVEAWSLQGGMIAWSAKNLPRVRPEYCVKR
jgi:cysteine synthase/rhodanese-related sulfurtransferase